MLTEYNIWLEEAQWEKWIQQLAINGKVYISDLHIDELIMGMRVEEEHNGKMGQDTNVTNNDSVKVLKIAVAHLREDPRYYTKLKKMERY